MRPISAEHKTLDGPRPHIVIADELHEHHSTLVLDKLTAGFKARKQPLSLEITNSGWDRETICFYHHDYSRQVLEGIVENDAWFAYVCQLDSCPSCRAAGKSSQRVTTATPGSMKASGSKPTQDWARSCRKAISTSK